MPVVTITRRASLMCCLFALALILPAASSAATGTLYAATGAGGGNCAATLSNLYTLDPATGAATLVGPITINNQQVRHVTGLAVKPNDGTLYATMGGQQTDCSDFGESTVMTVDPATGDATVVGTQGGSLGQYPDIDFDPFGTLYAWNENGDDLYTLSQVDGTPTLVGECDCGTSQTGLAVDSTGRMYMKPGNQLYRMNPGTGAIVSGIGLDQNPQNLLAFDPNDVLFTGTRNTGTFTLQTIDIDTGTVTDVGTSNVNNMSAIAFDPGTFTPPDRADLSLTNIVDDPNPEVGSDVTFTLQVTNGGPDNATGVEVTDLLPGGYSYVSDDGGTAYDSSTGIWTVGSLDSGNSATLNITATVVNTGGTGYDNPAEVTASDQLDPDSIPADDQTAEDDYATSSTDPFIAGRDGAASLTISGGTKANAKGKGFVVNVTNAGTSSLSVNSSQLTVSLNDDSGVVSCKSFSATLAPGRAVRVRCTANVAALGLSKGSSVTYKAELNIPYDEDSGNDVATRTVTLT
jgi:uncharacterized repeat protein (TIGR01451 family)